MHCFILRVRSTHFMIHCIVHILVHVGLGMSVNVCPVCMYGELSIDLWYHASGVTSSCDQKHVIVHCFYVTARCTGNLF